MYSIATLNRFTTEVFIEMIKVCNKDAKPIDIIQKGVEVLQNTDIDTRFKKEIIKAVIERIAYCNDGIKGTNDDRLSSNTVALLIVLIDSDLIDTLIEGVVATVKNGNKRCCLVM